MLDRDREHLIRLNKLVDHRTLKVDGQKKAVSTVWRWATKGVRGTILETTCIGGTRYTSLEAFQRFCDALDRARGTPTRAQSPSVAGERAARELETAGI